MLDGSSVAGPAGASKLAVVRQAAGLSFGAARRVGVKLPIVRHWNDDGRAALDRLAVPPSGMHLAWSQGAHAYPDILNRDPIDTSGPNVWHVLAFPHATRNTRT